MKLNDSNELNIVTLINALIKSRIFIVLFTSFFVFLAVFYSLSIDNIYGSRYQLSYTSSFSKDDNSSLAILDNLINTDAQMDSSGKFVIERMRSRDFFRILYKDEAFLKNLMAYDYFDSRDASNNYISSEYDENNTENPWVNGKPTLLNAHKEFIASNFEVGVDRETGIITITVFHESPYIAKDWADKILNEINIYIANIDRTRAQNAYDFLINKLQNSSVVEIKKSISMMMEKTFRASER